MIPHRWRARRSFKFMPKRGSDADNRIFFDQLVSLAASRLKATGAIRLEDRHGIIAFGDKQKLVGVAHTRFPNGGSWSYFRCPKCGPEGKKLWFVDDAPRCRLCLEKLGVRYRAAYGFGRTERLRERDRRVDRLQAMLDGGPMRFKPVPPNWGNRRLDRRNRLTRSVAASPYRHPPRPNSVPAAAKQRAAWAIAAPARLQTTRSRNRGNPKPQIALAGQINRGHRNRSRQCPINHPGSIGERRSANAINRRTPHAQDTRQARERGWS